MTANVTDSLNPSPFNPVPETALLWQCGKAQIGARCVCVHACVCGVVCGVHVCMCEHMDVTLLLPSFLPVCSSALHSVEQLATERVWLRVLSSMNKGMLSAWMNHALHPSPQLMRHAKHPVVG